MDQLRLGRLSNQVEVQMVKILGSAAMAGSILCALQTATGGPAAALDRHIQFTNNTRVTIVEIYIAEVGTGRWQQDLLGDEFLLPANSVLVDFDDAIGYCRFDLKFIYDDGTGVLRQNVNICREEGFALSDR
jgi:hypothetical protein